MGSSSKKKKRARDGEEEVTGEEDVNMQDGGEDNGGGKMPARPKGGEKTVQRDDPRVPSHQKSKLKSHIPGQPGLVFVQKPSGLGQTVAKKADQLREQLRKGGGEGKSSQGSQSMMDAQNHPSVDHDSHHRGSGQRGNAPFARGRLSLEQEFEGESGDRDEEGRGSYQEETTQYHDDQDEGGDRRSGFKRRKNVNDDDEGDVVWMQRDQQGLGPNEYDEEDGVQLEEEEMARHVYRPQRSLMARNQLPRPVASFLHPIDDQVQAMARLVQQGYGQVFQPSEQLRRGSVRSPLSSMIFSQFFQPVINNLDLNGVPVNLLDSTKPSQLAISLSNHLQFQNWIFTMISAGQTIVASSNDSNAKKGVLAEVQALTQLQLNISTRFDPASTDYGWIPFQAYVAMTLYEFLRSDPYDRGILSIWDDFRWMKAQRYADYCKASSPAKPQAAAASSTLPSLRGQHAKATATTPNKPTYRGRQTTRYDQNGAFKKGKTHPFDRGCFPANPEEFSCHNCSKAGWGAKMCPCHPRYKDREGYDKYRPKRSRKGNE